MANGVTMLELKIQNVVLNPTLIFDEQMAILVDVGMPGQWAQIQSAMEVVGVSVDKLRAIIVTHQDLDHIGSLPEIREQLPQEIEVFAHSIDKPYIEGQLHLIKTDPSRLSDQAWASIPDQMKDLYQNPPKSKVDKTLEDGEELPYCGGIQVIFTPGHTPGHISLYVKNSRTLIAGDALVFAEGKLRGPIQQTTLDMDTAFHSIEKFLDYNIESVICYHGGQCSENVKEQLENLVRNRRETMVKKFT